MVATTVFVAGSMTETVPLTWFATYRNPLSGLKAMPTGNEPTGMVATTKPWGAPVSVTRYEIGNGGFIANVIPASEPLKEIEDPLPVVAVMLNSFAAGQSTKVEVKLQTTCLVTVSVLVVGVVPFPGVCGDVIVDTLGCCCWMFLL
jgi:hypothetical protein